MSYSAVFGIAWICHKGTIPNWGYLGCSERHPVKFGMRAVDYFVKNRSKHRGGFRSRNWSLSLSITLGIRRVVLIHLSIISRNDHEVWLCGKTTKSHQVIQCNHHRIWNEIPLKPLVYNIDYHCCLCCGGRLRLPIDYPQSKFGSRWQNFSLPKMTCISAKFRFPSKRATPADCDQSGPVSLLRCLQDIQANRYPRDSFSAGMVNQICRHKQKNLTNRSFRRRFSPTAQSIIPSRVVDEAGTEARRPQA